MDLVKAPKPDGIPALFFHKFWHVINKDVLHSTLDILINKLNPFFFQHNSQVVLIPKIPSLKNTKDFRPTILCNVIFKVITKAIANKLKSILRDIIHLTQSSFVPGRLIIDHALITFETFHFLKQTRRGKRDYLTLKLDMSKVYNRVEWSFL